MAGRWRLKKNAESVSVDAWVKDREWFRTDPGQDGFILVSLRNSRGQWFVVELENADAAQFALAITDELWAASAQELPEGAVVRERE